MADLRLFIDWELSSVNVVLSAEPRILSDMEVMISSGEQSFNKDVSVPEL